MRPDVRKLRKRSRLGSIAEDEKMIEAEATYVENNWRITEDGNLKKNKKKFYKSKSLRALPKKYHA